MPPRVTTELQDDTKPGGPVPGALAIEEQAAPQSPVSPGSETSLPPRRRYLRREWLLLAVSVLILVAIIVPPLANLGRYQHQIVETISRSLGREVTMRGVSLRLLPTPALVLTDMVVSEEPGFGAEPALLAPSVIAQIRLTSLWRGWLEVSRVEMSDARLNLVRNREGRWNVGSVLLQASHVANAPTGQRRAGPAPRFPYIEITDSRVNVKQGAEKLPYSLLSANVSMWLAEPDRWQIRLDGQPVRTDIELGLSDTGILRIQGSLHRATALGHMPLALHADWTSAPLGQASRLLLGRDPGWRGDLHASGDVSGDLDDLAIKTHVTVANLHREEFTPAEPFAVDATCRAAYSREAHSLRDVSCRWPVGEGQLLLTGSLSAGSIQDGATRQSTLALSVQQLPASFLVAAAGLARSDFAPRFQLEGAWNGMLFYTSDGTGSPVVAGLLEAPRLRLTAAGLRAPLELADTRLAASTPTDGLSALALSTAPIDLGGAEPVSADAQLTGQGLRMHASGGAAIARLAELGRTSHLLPASLAWLTPRGMAEFDVTRNAVWHPGEVAPPPHIPIAPRPAAARHQRHQRQRHRHSRRRHARGGPVVAPVQVAAAGTSGWLRLRDAGYRPRFLPEPLLLPTAEATFAPGEITWSAPGATFHQIPLQLTANYPLECAGQPGCAAHFHASSSQLDAGALIAALMESGDQGHLFDDLMNRLNPNSSSWPAVEGDVHIDTLTLGQLALHDADTVLSIVDGTVRLRSLNAQLLGGALRSEGLLSLKDGLPHYELATTLTRVSAAAVGSLFHENWGGGSLTASARLELSGLHAEVLAGTAKGTFHAEWAHGGIGSHTPFARFPLWTGDGVIGQQTLTFTSGQLVTNQGDPLAVSGSIGFDRAVNLRLGPAGAADPATSPAAERALASLPLTVAGTLAEPKQPTP